MKRTWDRIHVWLRANAPAIFASLRPGASDEQIRAAEAQIGVSLPDDVRACYRIHDGQEDAEDGFPIGFLHGHPWCSLERMVREWRRLDEQYRRQRHDPDYDPRYVPLTVNLGVLFVLDLVPRPGSHGARVRLAVTNAGFHLSVSGDNFSSWLERFADDLDGGRYGVDPESDYLFVQED